MTRRLKAPSPIQALVLLFGCLALSALLRATDVADFSQPTSAVAQEGAAPKPAADAEQAAPDQDGGATTDAGADMMGDDKARAAADGDAADALPEPAADTAAGRVLAALRARERALAEHERRLAEREMALEAARRRVEERIAHLEAQRAEFESIVSNVRHATARDVDHLIAMYSKMGAKEAGALFDAMDPAFAAGFLARMKPGDASEIMANMQTPQAYAVSLELAGRNVALSGPATRAD